MALAGEGDDADVGVGLFGCGLEGGEEEFGEEEVAEVVGAELDFEAFFGLTQWDGHDACIEHEDIEALGFFLKCFSGGANGGEGGQVQGEIGDLG